MVRYGKALYPDGSLAWQNPTMTGERRFSKATWRGPVPNMQPGGQTPPLLWFVVHIQQGYETGTNATFHDPRTNVSAHFGNPKKGPLDQWVEVGDRAWAQAAGNDQGISVENEGFTGHKLTRNQLRNLADLYTWCHLQHGIPLVITQTPARPGLIGHGQGGAPWGNHPDCPGAPILKQRAKILRMTRRRVRHVKH
jgi:N-acetylmuramoyl-L-alanine amidase